MRINVPIEVNGIRKIAIKHQLWKKDGDLWVTGDEGVDVLPHNIMLRKVKQLIKKKSRVVEKKAHRIIYAGKHTTVHTHSYPPVYRAWISGDTLNVVKND
jgi:hypothetical protein